MRLVFAIILLLASSFSFAETEPSQAEQLANRCQSYQFILTGPNMTQQARFEVQNLLYNSKTFAIVKDDDFQRRFLLVVFKLKPSVKRKQQLVEGLREILSIENSELSCTGSVGAPGL